MQRLGFARVTEAARFEDFLALGIQE